jgi:hypothetical protein
MTVAPDLFVYDHAVSALATFETLLLGKHQLGGPLALPVGVPLHCLCPPFARPCLL